MTGADLAGAFVMEVTIALSLGISWASYASDYSRYLPVHLRRAVFGYTFAGLALAYIAVQALGVAAAGMLTDQTAEGIRSVMGGGALGAAALLVIALGSVASNAMNDYSGSLAMQTTGLRVRRPVSAAVVAAMAFALIMWLHAGDLATRFQSVLPVRQLLDPGVRRHQRRGLALPQRRARRRGPGSENTPRRDAVAALVSFAVAFAAATPFMHTDLFVGPLSTDCTVPTSPIS